MVAFGRNDLCATPATMFPERRIGHLDEGYEASFLVLPGDPLEEWRHTRRIQLRVKQGLQLCPRR